MSEALTAESFIPLRGGLVVRVEAVRLLLDLEARGVRVERDDDDVLLHAPAHRITDEDRALLRRFKPHVLALIDYCSTVH